jgi:hypothetical protein
MSATDDGAEILDGEPGHTHLDVDGALSDRFEQMGFARPRRSGHHQVLRTRDPLEGA